MYMTSADIRQAFLDYFQKQGHRPVASGSLVPGNDPTLMFTNAGMNQFKDVFLGTDKRDYTRATTAQRCVRAGGKHNDLENVGYTARHHTFFEMLGNFSFGDYFKEEAIEFAWDFLTNVIKLPKEKLWVTVFEEDLEAEKIWIEKIGVDPDRLSRIGAKDNFWQMGDTGPCGPCTEIFYDHGEEVAGGPPGTPEEDGDRYIEIWNLVFMQYNRQADGTMDPLPRPSVDTGMGLERLAAILQGVHSNYETDTFQALIKRAAELVGVADLEHKSLRVIADHIRACAFLVADGVMPSNEGRGYVLRRIIRRAIRHGHMLGGHETFFYKLVPALVEQMGAAYDELNTQQPVIEKILRLEEEQFRRTLERGLNLLEAELGEISGKEIPGELAFKLSDTYGFPFDLTADIARERGFTVDQAGFDTALAAQRERAKQASKFAVDYNEQLNIELETEFTGYGELLTNAKVIALFKEGEQVEQLQSGEDGLVVLDKSPFYAESGGQVGDIGVLAMDDGAFNVQDTRKFGQGMAVKGYVEHGEIHVGEELTAEVDPTVRAATALNHTATHLLHAALREVLGEHVQQKGSQVGPDRLRFDFSHFESPSLASLKQVESLVNEQIRANHELVTREMSLEDAKAAGAMALFGEKYDDDVRVVSLGEFSTELCGGTHVKRSGDIGMFTIIAEGGIAAGVRRIEAVTGQGALDFKYDMTSRLEELAGMVKGDTRSVVDRVRQALERNKLLEREIEQLKGKLAAQAGGSLADSAELMGDVKVLVAELTDTDPKALRGMMDDLKAKLQRCVILLGVGAGSKVSLIAGVSKDLTGQIKSGELVNVAAAEVGGKGGGRPDMAQAGGSQPQNLAAALDKGRAFIADKL